MKKSHKLLFKLGLSVVFTGLALLVSLPQGPNFGLSELKLHLGLDLAGGARLLYQADMSEVPQVERKVSLEGARDILEQRVNSLGVGEPVVKSNISGQNYRVVVELPGITNLEEAISKIGATPTLEFKEVGEPVELTASEKEEVKAYNQAAKVKAEKLLAQVQGMSDQEFSLLADQETEDPTNKEGQGGSLPFMGRKSLVPEFADYLFDQLNNQATATELVETIFGWHIIRRLADQETESGEQQVSARHILIKSKSLKPQGGGNFVKTSLNGKHLERSVFSYSSQTSEPVVNLKFNNEGKDLFAQITAKNVGKAVAIFLDGQLISAPRVNEEIKGGEAVISGQFSLPEAKELVKRLNSGALPVPIKLVSQAKVGPTLGRVAVETSFLAFLLGLLMVVIFILINYRWVGLVAVMALTSYTLIMTAIFKLVPVTLTLSGAAGFILSIGIAVDANVLVFERLKEELRAGSSVIDSIKVGFDRAWPSIRDANVSSVITALVLIWLSSGLIRGFAITFLIGIGVSIFSAITLTKVYLLSLAQFKFFRTSLKSLK